MHAQQHGARLVAVIADSAGHPAADHGFSPTVAFSDWLTQLVDGRTALRSHGARLYQADEPRARAVARFIGDRLWLRPQSLGCLSGGLVPAHVGGALHELRAAPGEPPTFVVGAREVLAPALGYLEQLGLIRPLREVEDVAVLLQDRGAGAVVGIDGPMAELERLALRDVAHLGINLHDHLVNTYGLLRDFGNPEAVCLAGLYHAAYGTQGFDQAVFEPSDRTVLAELIGPGAESLVYHYCASDRDHAELSALAGNPRAFRDRFTGTRKTLTHGLACALWEMTLANELEIGTRDRAFVERYRPGFTRLFAAARPYLSRMGYDRFRYVFR